MPNPNYPSIVNPVFQRANRAIVAITNDFPALVTTIIPHQYITGMIVRIVLPGLTYRNQSNQVIGGFGMDQINKKFSKITIVEDEPTQFYIDIDTTMFDPFVLPPDRDYGYGDQVPLQYAQAIPIGEIPSLLRAAKTNVLPYPLRFNP
jgi:hypothetical protein